MTYLKYIKRKYWKNCADFVMHWYTLLSGEFWYMTGVRTTYAF